MEQTACMHEKHTNTDYRNAVFNHATLLIFKATRGCNIQCRYCSATASPGITNSMSRDTFVRAIDIIIRSSRIKHLTFELHGGEPLLMPDSLIAEIAEYSNNKAAEAGKVIHWRVQTNGIALTEERFHKLSGLGFDIGISVDGPADISDRMRGKGKDTWRAIEMLIRQRYQFGLIAVIYRHNLREIRRVFEKFERTGIHSFQANIMASEGRAIGLEPLSKEEVFQANVDIIDCMLDSQVVTEGVNETRIRRFLGDETAAAGHFCLHRNCQAGLKMFCFDTDGTIYPCDTYWDDSSRILGNIMDAELDAASIQTILEGIHSRAKNELGCFNCIAKKTCIHGCAQAWENAARRDTDCLTEIALYRYLEKRQGELERFIKIRNAFKGKAV